VIAWKDWHVVVFAEFQHPAGRNDAALELAVGVKVRVLRGQFMPPEAGLSNSFQPDKERADAQLR
jgi:hypothetical protein